MANHLEEMLFKFKNGEINENEIINYIKTFGNEDLGFANIDHHRLVRQGMPEVIYAAGKAPKQTATIFQKLMQKNDCVMATRADKETYEVVAQVAPSAVYYEDARIVAIKPDNFKVDNNKKIVVCTAGTSDIPVAEEAAVTAELLGNSVERVYDVGVAGIHRLFAKLPILQEASVIIAIAGMEGALVSVIGGLVDKPIIAVPTSVGYGASFGGLSALLTMLNSCASGVGVVNIDNGFGAGVLASRIVGV